jgi:excisionase family DNA binding protein
MDNTNHKPLSVQQAADRMGVSYQTAYRMIRSGELAAAKIRRQWRIPAAEVERLLEPLPFSVPPCEE